MHYRRIFDQAEMRNSQTEYESRSKYCWFELAEFNGFDWIGKSTASQSLQILHMIVLCAKIPVPKLTQNDIQLYIKTIFATRYRN